MKFNKVLLCTDFSKESKRLMEKIKYLIKYNLKEVILFNVLDYHTIDTDINSFKDEKKKIFKEDIEYLESRGIKVDIKVKIGNSAIEIVKKSNEENVDLILMGSYGKGWVKRMFLGSTTFDVVRLSEKPVLIEKYKDIKDESVNDDIEIKDDMFKKVLVPMDFSKHALRTLEKIKTIVDVENIVLLTAIEYSIDEIALKEIKDELETKLSKMKIDLFKEGFNSNYMIKEGIASSNIIEAAENEGVGLTVISKRGEGIIKELIIGSTASSVMINSNTPVLIFPSKK